MEAYRPYLVGSKFTVYTDHRALIWLQSTKHTGRLERRALKLQEYNFEIKHRPEMSNYVADALSRIPYPKEDQPEITMTTNDAQDSPPSGILVNLYYEPDETGIISLEQDVDLSKPDQKSLIEMQAECPNFQENINYLQNNITCTPDNPKCRDSLISEAKHYTIVDGVLAHFYQRRCKRQPVECRYISQIALPRVLRREALKQYHDSIAGGGHLGIEKVRTALRSRYF